MKLLNVLPLLLFLVLLAMFPFVFGQVFTSALIKLKLEPASALLIVIGIFLGSPINIPVKRISRTESVSADPLAVFGLSGWWPMLQRERRETLIAVNVGGCLIPVALAIYETAHLLTAGLRPISGLLLAIFINTMVCYWLAKPIEGIGIAMPGLFPALLAAVSALLLVPDQAPPVAFVAGARPAHRGGSPSSSRHRKARHRNRQHRRCGDIRRDRTLRNCRSVSGIEPRLIRTTNCSWLARPDVRTSLLPQDAVPVDKSHTGTAF